MEKLQIGKKLWWADLAHRIPGYQDGSKTCELNAHYDAVKNYRRIEHIFPNGGYSYTDIGNGLKQGKIKNIDYLVPDVFNSVRDALNEAESRGVKALTLQIENASLGDSRFWRSTCKMNRKKAHVDTTGSRDFAIAASIMQALCISLAGSAYKQNKGGANAR